MSVAIVFGASGSIGSAIGEHLQAQGFAVIGVGRNKNSASPPQFSSWVIWNEDAGEFSCSLSDLLAGKKIDAIVWAQGANLNDDIDSFDLTKHLQMYEANVTFILCSLQALLKAEFLAKNARLVVISSIWQNIARQTKLSYCITKSALQGLVQSLSIDLGRQGILINAVLPGALDTPMTRVNLQEHQISALERATPLQSLPNLSDVTGLTAYLCSSSNTGITGQFIAADRGFSNARIL